jgi:3-hydroxyacyl-CoA dehydrogenase/enoyl-CoA hydratase/3-hydroxybutyryl-CoA epimerase
MSPAAGDALLARITPTADAADLAGADVVIDTTGDEPPAEVADALAPDALRCSTSATPAGDVVGLHFFTPVDKAPLVEILAGPKTGDAALARAFDLVRQLHRTPIVVHGPFTGRVVTTFLDEAVAMAGEGAPAASIEQAGIQAGYPAPALRGLGLAERVTKDAAAGPAGPIPFEDMTQRLLFAAALETVRCLDEGVLRSEPEANIGSIMGVGFPAWTGGALQYVRGYPGGQPAFVARARELAERYGDRFDPPDSLAGGAGG